MTWGLEAAQKRVAGVGAWLALALVALGVAGCERDPTGRDGTLSANEFVEIIVALRTAEREVAHEVPADSVAFEYERRKAEILERYDASEADLHEFMEQHYARPGLMSAVWDSITERLRTPPEELGDTPDLEGTW